MVNAAEKILSWQDPHVVNACALSNIRANSRKRIATGKACLFKTPDLLERAWQRDFSRF